VARTSGTGQNATQLQLWRTNTLKWMNKGMKDRKSNKRMMSGKKLKKTNFQIWCGQKWEYIRV